MPEPTVQDTPDPHPCRKCLPPHRPPERLCPQDPLGSLQAWAVQPLPSSVGWLWGQDPTVQLAGTVLLWILSWESKGSKAP